MSNLPPVEEVLSESATMRIERVVVNQFPVERQVKTMLNLEAGKIAVKGVHGDVYCVQDPRIQGYLPSKAWITFVDRFGIPTIEMSFYVNETLPPSSRPFGDGPMYVLPLQVEPEETLSYDINTRVLIDQLMFGSKIWYIFCFGQKQYDQFIQKPPTEKSLEELVQMIVEPTRVITG